MQLQQVPVASRQVDATESIAILPGQRVRQQLKRSAGDVTPLAVLPDLKKSLGGEHDQTAGSVKVGSLGSRTSTSRSQPSFSSLSVWMATALAFASISETVWKSDGQHR